MAKWYSKLSFYKGLSDVFLILVVLSFTTNWISEELYPIASIGLLLGLIVTITYLVKQILKK